VNYVGIDLHKKTIVLCVMNADFRGGVTCLIDTQFLPEGPAISPVFYRALRACA
jgi:hypothetical protein